MNESHVTRRRIGFASNPGLLLVASSISLVFGVGSAILLHGQYTLLADTSGYASVAAVNRAVAHPWSSLFLGILIGVLPVLWLKHSLQKHRDHHIESAMLSKAEKLRRPIHKPSIIDSLFVTATPALAGVVAIYLQIAWLPAFWGPGILYFLAYPEQRSIYRDAVARLNEARLLQ